MKRLKNIHSFHILAERFLQMLALVFILGAVFSAKEVRAQEIQSVWEVSDFEELKEALNQTMSTGGRIRLTSDIRILAEESYTYTNGRYRKEVVLETSGHTIYVEGYLNLWAFLQIQGNGGTDGIFHVLPGGELWLTSIPIDVEDGGTAIIQENGGFLVYGSSDVPGTPEFTCSGKIIAAEKTAAAAYIWYNMESIPIVRIPEGAEFSASMLPECVMARVNLDHSEVEQEVPVTWDESTFPKDGTRTFVTGAFAGEYTGFRDALPGCLVIWESEESPFFLNAYAESYGGIRQIYLYAECPQTGTVRVESSADGKVWSEITDIEGYEPVETEEGEEFCWYLWYEKEDETPKYYRMALYTEDGTVFYSETLEFKDDYFLAGTDIDGGRGGETSPGEGEDQLPDKVEESGAADVLTETYQTYFWQNGSAEAADESGGTAKTETGEKESEETEADEIQQGEENEPSDSDSTETSESDSGTEKESHESDQTGEMQNNAAAEKLAGIVIVLLLLCGTAGIYIVKCRKK